MKSSFSFSLFPLLATLVLYILLSSLVPAMYFFIGLIAKMGGQRVLVPVTWGQQASRVGQVASAPRGAAHPAARGGPRETGHGAGHELHGGHRLWSGVSAEAAPNPRDCQHPVLWEQIVQAKPCS